MMRGVFVGLALAAVLLTGCGKKSPPAVEATENGGTAGGDASSAAVAPANLAKAAAAPAADPRVVLHTSAGDITLQLFQQKAPRTVENFLRGYAERGFYDQTIFHHVEPGSMLIAGGYTEELERKQTRSAIYNESRNGLSNRRATVAMIREPDSPHSATSEFFINLADNAAFDHQSDGEEEQHGYCVFGEVVGGMEIVDRIAKLETTAKGDFTRVPSPAATILSVERLR